MAIENYMPDFAVEAVYDLTVPSLQAQGIKAVLVDLDNTLIAWNNPDGTPEMKQWLHDLRDAGIRIIVVSNNTKKRVQRAVEKFGIDYVYWALKPFTFGIDRAMKEFHYEKSEVVMVGDQLMTDIRAAHRAGIRSILVKPLVQHDSIKTQINRARERRVMRKITEKYGPITHQKGIYLWKKFSVLVVEQAFRRQTRLVLDLPPSRHLKKVWRLAKSIANAVSVSATTMKSRMSS